MKIATEVEANIQRSGLLHEKQFGIIFDHKMSKILSDGLYQDKIASIIREISCNALDSHVEAGHPDLPFEVHLPTSLEPWFSVKDFGVGLSSEQVKRIYTIYGSSTKTQSNDVIGQLGLGSKSPFSYADAFDVIAVKNGVMSIYSMYKDEYGMPCCAELVADQTTDDPNGVTVKIPVTIGDIREWHSKAVSIYKWFPVTPKMTGQQMVIPPVEYLWSTVDWGIVAGETSYYEKNVPLALMGNVAYPINVTSIKGNLTTQQAQILEQCRVVLRFAIGDLEVTASREGLGYDARTIANIRKKLDIMTAEIRPLFEKRLSDAPTLWEARKLFGAMKAENRGLHYKLFYPNGLKWRNQTIDTNQFEIRSTDFYDLVDVVDATGKSIKIPNAEMRVVIKDDMWKRPRRIDLNNFNITADKNVKIFVCDIKSAANARLVYNHKDYQTYYMFYPTAKMTLDKLKTYLGDVDIQLMSTLPAPVKQTKPVSPVLKILKYDYSYPTNWVEETWNQKAGGVYVELDRWDIKCFNRTYGAAAFDRLKEKLVTAGLIDSKLKIYAGRNKTRKELVTDSNWVTLEEHVKKNARAMNLTALIEDIQILNFTIQSDRQFENMLTVLCELTDRKTTGLFDKHVLEIQNIVKPVQNRSRSLTQLNEMMGLVEIEGNEIVAIHAQNQRFKILKSNLESIKQRYPGLTHMKTTEALSVYVDLVDENQYLRQQLSLTIPAE